MRIGQTSLIVFLAKLLGSALGFLATLVFARVVGAEIFGIYTLILTVLSWLAFAGHLGIGSAMTKRISEGEDSNAYLSAGVIWVFSIGAIVSLLVIIAQPVFESYISGFDQYLTISVVWVLIALLFVRFFYKLPFEILHGERKVHIAALLDPLKRGGRSVLQIGLVLAGYSLFGMLLGYVIGGVIVGIISLYFVSLRPARPGWHHFRSLFEYAKYSWFGSLKSKIFNDIDIIILGIFVPSSTVGVYAVAWSLSKFLEVFSGAISSTLFPEISYTATQESLEAVGGMVKDSFKYAGLIVIPGFVGGSILSSELMLVYGREFIEGATVLWLLIIAISFHAYQSQLVNALNGVDRPDLAFRVNVVFASLNAGLNILLIPVYGINGAAFASLLSVVVALLISYVYVNRLLTFTTPFGEIIRQLLAAVFMGALVFGVREFIEITGIIQHQILIVLILVLLGASVYFTSLIIISADFRATVDRNLPVTVPKF